MSFFTDIALPLAEIGWPVFPLKPRGKKPLIAKEKGGQGFKDATTNKAQIEEWGRLYPHANVGIATGASGLVVVDIDGPEGEALLATVSGGDVPPTLEATTGREGGRHLYYLGTDCPSSSIEDEHLDVRGNTGYVVAPGSIHPSGRVYAWKTPLRPPVPRPAWVPLWIPTRRGKNTAVLSLDLPGAAPRAPNGKRRLVDRATDGMSGGEPFSWGEARRLMSALAAIPSKIDGKTWCSYLAALHDLYWIVNGVDVGLEIADKWSSLSDGKGEGNHEYKGRVDIEKRWASFEKEYNGKRVTVGSIYAHAKSLGWVYQECIAEPVVVNGHNGLAAIPASLRADTNAIRFPDTDKFGKPKPTCANARAALRMLGVSCGYDEFHDRMHMEGRPIGQWAGDLTDNAVHMLRVVIQQQYRFDPGTQGVFDAAVQECLQHAYDPVQDYLDALVWDRRPRLAGWLGAYLGADESPLTSEIGKLSLLAAVRRAREPGTKFDQIIVLEGVEGKGKSSAIQLLAGRDNFSDQAILTLDDRGQQEAIEGIWLYEIADLQGLSRADIERTKAFASRTWDRARPAYGRKRVDRPRRCVFFATTNSDTYLQSPTGNRRFWPVRTGRIDLDALARDRDQLWAEAVFWEETGARLALPEGMWGAAADLQETRREHDPWDEDIAAIERRHLKGKAHQTPDAKGMEYRVATKDVLNLVLRLPIEKQNPVTAKRVANSMRRLGWDGPKLLRDGEEIMRGWTKPAGNG